MIVCDVNLLLHASMQRMPEHRRARAWLADVLSEPGTLGLSHLALFGYLRIATNRRVFDPPRPVEEALEDVASWLDAGAVLVSPGPRHLDIAFRLLREQGTAGNLTTDVQLAALAMEHQTELHSADTDFGRFKGLRWVNPLAHD